MSTCHPETRDHIARKTAEGKTHRVAMQEKHQHFLEIQETAARHREQQDEIDARAGASNDFDRYVRPDVNTT